MSHFEINFLMFLSETGETIEALNKALKTRTQAGSGPGPRLNVHAKAVTTGQEGGHEGDYKGAVKEEDAGRQSSPALAGDYLSTNQQSTFFPESLVLT